MGFFLIAVALSGCPSSQKEEIAGPAEDGKAKVKTEAKSVPKTVAKARPESKSTPAATTETEETSELPLPGGAVSKEISEEPRDLGPPLVDNPEDLIHSKPKEPVWIDPKNKQVVLQGEVCKAGYPLEFFATYSNRSYEAVVSVNATPSVVHACLLVVGAVAGHPARFQPEFVPPTGTEVAIEVRWKDDKGNVQSVPAQQWIRNIKTKKALDSNWVFAGSQFLIDETTKKEYYQADSGELICVLSLPNAMLDLPILSYGALDARQFEAFEEHLPPSGTPVTILLKPVLGTKPIEQPPLAKEAGSANEKHAEAERLAVEAAEPWLALVDQAEYTRSWETAARRLKDNIERRDFVKKLGASRKPLGDVASRKLESKQYVTSVPGAPAGQYVVLTYATSFANGKSAIETVTSILDKDKKWRVSGYTVK